MSLLNEQFRICPPFESAANRMLKRWKPKRWSATIILLFDIRGFNGREISTKNPLHEKDCYFREYRKHAPYTRMHMFAGRQNKNCKIEIAIFRTGYIK